MSMMLFKARIAYSLRRHYFPLLFFLLFYIGLTPVQAKETVELCTAIDGSPSVWGDQFQLQLEGIASAIENPIVVPQDGTVTISVVQFGIGNAKREIPPILIDSQATADRVAMQVRSISQEFLLDDYPAIDLCVQSFSFTADKQVIDIASDGYISLSSIWNSYKGYGTELNEVEAINMLVVGNYVLDPDIVKPQPVSEFPQDGFIYYISSYDEYANAMKWKMAAETGQLATFAANEAPTANEVTISGDLLVGATLTGQYTYDDADDDPEATSTFQWYTATDAECSENQTPIKNATTQTYTLTNQEIDKYLCFGVIPEASSGPSPGMEAIATSDNVVVDVPPELVEFTLTVAVSGTGKGVVTNEELDCGSTCQASYLENTQVPLTAQATEASEFMGWQGDCSGTESVASVMIDAEKTCTAIFDVKPPPVIEPVPEPVEEPKPAVEEPQPDPTEVITPEEPPEPAVEESTAEEPVAVSTPEPLPAETPKPCPPVEILDYYCNAQWQTVNDLLITENPQTTNGVGFLANAVVEGNLTLEPGTWASNLDITANSQVTGGVITGLNYNAGYMGDFEFRGEFIKGGTLGGFILNTSKIRNYFENVTFAPNAHLIGGVLKGKIQGDPAHPALLEHVKVLAGSHLSNVIIGEGVILADDVVVTSAFPIGISVNDGEFLMDNTAHVLTDHVKILGQIQVTAAHVGQSADIFVTVSFQPDRNKAKAFLNTLEW